MVPKRSPEQWFRTPEQLKPLSAEAFLVRCLARGLVEVFGVNAKNERVAITAELVHTAQTLGKTIDTSTLNIEGLLEAIEAGDTEQVETIITELFNTKEQVARQQMLQVLQAA